MMPANRLDALTDGVVAIVVTLLVLDLRLPEGVAELEGAALLQALVEMRHAFASYALSFVVVGALWINHVRTVRGQEAADPAQTWLTLGFLGIVALLPFTTALLSRSHSALATAIYAGSMMLASGLLSAMAARVERDGGVRGLLRHAALPGLFALSIAIAPVSSEAARLSWLLIAPASLLGAGRPRRA